MLLLLTDHLTMQHFIAYIIIVLILLSLVGRYKNKKYPKPTFIKTQHNSVSLLLYLDKYYISNIYATFISVIVYLIIHIGIIFFLRLFYIKSVADFQKIHLELITYKIIFVAVSSFFIFLLALFLTYVLLDLLFYDGLIKLYLYFFRKISPIKLFMLENTLVEYLGPIYLFIDTISYLRLKPDYAFYDDHYRFDNIYSKLFINNMTIFFVKLCKKNCVFSFIFIFFRIFLKLCYIHLNFNFIVNTLVRTFVIIYFFYTLFFFKSFENFYYILVFYLMLTLFYKAYMFVYLKESSFDYILYHYFYNNDIKYKNQRPLLTVIRNSKENSALYNSITDNDTIYYILNNFKQNQGDTVIIKNISTMYLRFGIILIFIFFALYLILNRHNFIISMGQLTLPIYITSLPLFFMIYFSKKAYKLKKDAEIVCFSEYTFDKNYARLFWLMTFIQLYVYWIFILKHVLFFFE